MLREPAFFSTTLLMTLSCQVMPMMMVKTLQTVLLSGIGCPGLAAVKQAAEDARHLELDFGVLGQLIVVPHSLAQLGQYDSSFVNALVNFFVRLLVTVESSTSSPVLIDGGAGTS